MRIANLLFFLLVTLVLLPASSFGQTSQNRWAISLGGGIAQFQPFPGTSPDYVPLYDPIFSVASTRYLRGGFDFRTQLAGSHQVRIPVGEDRLSTTWMDMSYHLVYKFNNGLFLKEDARIGPYLLLGIGGSYANQRPDAYVPLGGGIRFRVSSQFSLRVESVRKLSINKQPQQIAHQIAFIYNLPSGEKGVSPKPESSNSRIMALVPQDLDQDGVADIEDNCPEQAGSPTRQGCPENDTVSSFFVQTKDPTQITEDPGLVLEESMPKTQEEAMAYWTGHETEAQAGEPSGEVGHLSMLGAEGEAYTETIPSPSEAISKPLSPTNKQTTIDNAASPAFVEMEASPTFMSFPPASESASRKPRPEVDLSPCAEYTAGAAGISPVFFELGSDELDLGAYERLDYIANAMKACGDISLVLDGHADAMGQEETNLVLSIKRAYNVKYYLVYEHGISQQRIVSAGWGESQPVADNQSLQGRGKNRRVDFQFVF